MRAAPPPSPVRPIRRARGQALVETTVVLVALLPLLFAAAWLAKLVDLRQAATSAARQAAFDCAARPDACAAPGAAAEIAAHVRRRAFAAAQGAARDDDRAAGEALAPEREAFRVDRSGRSLLERFEDVTVEIARPRFDSPLAFAGSQGESAFPGAVRVLSELAGPARFGLDLEGGLLEARVQVAVSRSRSIDDWLRRALGMPLRMQARLAVLADPWTASGPYGGAPDSVETRVHAGARLPLLEPALDAGWLPARGLLAAAAAVGLESRGDELRWRRVDVDLLPPDRLASGAPPVPPPHDVEFELP